MYRFARSVRPNDDRHRRLELDDRSGIVAEDRQGVRQSRTAEDEQGGDGLERSDASNDEPVERGPADELGASLSVTSARAARAEE